MLKAAIIGVGRQGGKYYKYFLDNKIVGAKLVAVCDIRNERLNELNIPSNIKQYVSYDEMFENESLDFVIINTPHYVHPEISKAALLKNIHVLCDKPIGVYANDAVDIKKYESNSSASFTMLFNQRMHPVYNRIKEIISTNKLGKIKRCIWQITDWYRPQKYYELGDWHSTWSGEGGGVLINQSVHNFDLLAYFFGLPKKISSSVQYGVFHNTKVDDSAIANLFYEDFVCTVITSTGECPGTNRLEISGDKGKLVYDEFDKLKLTYNEISETEFSKTAVAPPNSIKFGKPKTYEEVEYFDAKTDTHLSFINKYISDISNSCATLTGYMDGIMCLHIINGIYFSDWISSMVTIPVDGNKFEEKLKERFEQ